jgi:hypothetical protein
VLNDKAEAGRPLLEAGANVLIVFDKKNANGSVSCLSQSHTG